MDRNELFSVLLEIPVRQTTNLRSAVGGRRLVTVFLWKVDCIPERRDNELVSHTEKGEAIRISGDLTEMLYNLHHTAVSSPILIYFASSMDKRNDLIFRLSSGY